MFENEGLVVVDDETAERIEGGAGETQRDQQHQREPNCPQSAEPPESHVSSPLCGKISPLPGRRSQNP